MVRLFVRWVGIGARIVSKITKTPASPQNLEMAQAADMCMGKANAGSRIGGIPFMPHLSFRRSVQPLFSSSWSLQAGNIYVDLLEYNQSRTMPAPLWHAHVVRTATAGTGIPFITTLRACSSHQCTSLTVIVQSSPGLPVEQQDGRAEWTKDVLLSQLLKP